VTALIAAATAATNLTRLREFRDIANEKNADEASRQTSIVTRAQGLFVALALFGLLFTFGASLLTQTTQLAKWELWVCFLFVGYILAQITIMVVNIVGAIGPIGYVSAGSSDMEQWLKEPTDEGFYRAQALLTLDHYRRAVLNNNWRFDHLGRALKGLRNIVLALSLLILCLFVAAIVAPPPIPVVPQIQVIEPYRDSHRHYHWPHQRWILELLAQGNGVAGPSEPAPGEYAAICAADPSGRKAPDPQTQRSQYASRRSSSFMAASVARSLELRQNSSMVSLGVFL
jgi:hypothetical protein